MEISNPEKHEQLIAVMIQNQLSSFFASPGLIILRKCMYIPQ